MAKKKKTSKAKKRIKKIEDTSPQTVSYFWRQMYAFLLIVLAIFIFLGGFGMGGKLPQSLFDITAWFVGFVAFLVPFILIYLAVHKLRHEEFVIPLNKLLSTILFIVSFTGALHVFIDVEQASAAAADGTYGGHIGSVISAVMLSFLNDITAFSVLMVLSVMAIMFMFGLSPKILWQKLKNLFSKEEAEEESQEEPKRTFELHENVPVEHTPIKKEDLAAGPRKSFKNTAMPLTAAEDHQALLTATDLNWKKPPITLLSNVQSKANPGDIDLKAERIKQALSNFGIDVEMEGANVGPRVTQYTLRAPNGVKMSKIVGLSDNITYELEATSIRIEAPIPGKKAVGIEVPNEKSAIVTLRSMLNRQAWQEQTSNLAFAVGLDIAGEPMYLDLADMPHLLVAGQTKAGKSVLINALLTSLLYNNSPADLKLILIDPKSVELAPYNDIPHLLTPIIDEPDKCISSLKWAVAEMERRYKSMKELGGVRSIAEYNAKKQEEGMPYIVIVIDELNEYMQLAGRDLENIIVRLAQKARAVGIHLVLATQRPSVDVITGVIKANIPGRIAFTVSQQVDSRTIIDQIGAEKLLGSGDMLIVTPEIPKPKRLQGAFISIEETERVTAYLRNQAAPTYDDEVVSLPVVLNGRGGIVPDTASTSSHSDSEDEAFKDAVQVVIDTGKASTSLLQRRLRLGYGRASRIIDEMEERGIIGPADGSRPREVLVSSVAEALGTDDELEESDEPRQIEVSDDPRDEYLTR